MAVDLLVECINRLGGDAAVGGWAIEGFPQTKDQAQLLEYKLSGYAVDIACIMRFITTL